MSGQRAQEVRSSVCHRGAPSVLVVGNYRPSLTVVRSLAQAGFRVIVGTGGVAFAHRSKACSEAWCHPSIEDESESFVQALSEFLREREDIEQVFPVSEEALLLVVHATKQLPTRVKIVSPAQHIVDACLDKTNMLTVAQSLGVPTQPFVLAENLTQVAELTRQHGFPCVIRPTVSGLRLLARKALIVESSAQLTEQLTPWPDGHGTLLAQVFAEGVRHNVYFLADRGNVCASGEVKILRTDRSDGTGLAVEGVSIDSDPALDEYVSRIAAHFNYTGLGCAQFHVDTRTGAVAFLELNPRLGANFAVVHHCGLPLAPLAAELAARGQVNTDRVVWRANQRYAWLYGDLAGLVWSWRAGHTATRDVPDWLLQAIKSAVRAQVHLTWSIRDPMPTLLTYASNLRKQTTNAT